MRGEYASPNSDSPPRPSTWQLRFGKKSASRSHRQPKDSAEIRSRSPESRSPSIADQLLRALDAKPKEEKEGLSRECVDQLIGRRNAFAAEPELRLRSRTRLSESDSSSRHDHYDHEDTAAEAKEILRVRFQIENQADALRQTSGHQKYPKRRGQTKYSTATQSSSSKRPPNKLTLQTDSRLSHTSAQEKRPRVRLMRTEDDNQKAETVPTKDEAKVLRKQPHKASLAGISSKKPHVRQLPPRQLPMERRHELLQQTRKDRKLKATETQTLLQLRQHVAVDNNKEDIPEQLRIEEQIQRLTVENALPEPRTVAAVRDLQFARE